MNPKGKKKPLNPLNTAKKKSVRRKQKSTANQSFGLFNLKQTKNSPKKKSTSVNHLAASSNQGSLGSSSTKVAVKPKSISSKNTSAKVKLSFPPQLSWWLGIYVVTIIVGLSTILGTTISIANSFQTASTQEKSSVATSNPKNTTAKIKLEQLLATASWGQEINPLRVKLETLAQEYPDLQPGIFLADIDTKGFVSIQGNQVIASASTIKLPILVAFLQDLDQGKIRLDEQLSITAKTMAGGSGDLQAQPLGTKFSALEIAEKMIVISDNTATNMLIEHLGGREILNQRFSQMGLIATKLHNPLPDLTGTNTTSPEDLGNLLLKIESGELLSLRSRDRLLHIMGNVVKDTLLPQGLESGAIIAHKTGDIKSVLADVGMIDMPNGKRYVASMLIKRPDNDPQAEALIQKASGIAYQYFKNPQITQF